jgi:hypothetical protein
MYSYNIDLEDETEELVANIIADYGESIIEVASVEYNKLK